jgi:hypothetical protein
MNQHTHAGGATGASRTMCDTSVSQVGLQNPYRSCYMTAMLTLQCAKNCWSGVMCITHHALNRCVG